MHLLGHLLLFLVWVQIVVVGAMALEIQIRPASERDVATARTILLKQAMNPLAVKQERLLVANVVKSDDTTMSAGEIALAGFGQIRPVDENYAELASLYVMPGYRRKGIATMLISKLLEQYDAAAEATKQRRMVCLLTLRPTAPLYEPHGFRVIPKQEMPKALQFEYAAGSFISAVLGNDLICMLRPNPCP